MSSIQFASLGGDSKKKRILDLNLDFDSPEQIVLACRKYGCLFITSDDLTVEKFVNFNDSFTLQYANDAKRRSSLEIGKGKIRGVDPGRDAHQLHSEASFSPSWPRLICFYAKEPDELRPAATTLADGVNIWKQLSTSTKRFFLEHPVMYECAVPITAPNPNTRATSKEYFFEEPGLTKARFDPKTGLLHFTQKRYCVIPTFNDDLAFVTHAFHNPKDPQILSVKFEGAVLPELIQQEVLEVFEAEIYEHNWDAKTIVMVDNRRMMHGRREIPVGSKRDLLIMQPLRIKKFHD
jgi:alpha-ketoglutarate-dependent taurine dioxygenase